MPGFTDHRKLYLLLPLVCLILVASPGQLSAQHAGSDVLLINSICFEGNKITRERIIRRELMFEEGDTLKREELVSLLGKSRENLLNTSLFNFVSVDMKQSNSGSDRVDVSFVFTERWYIWPWPVIEFADRNFNSWWQDNRDLSRMSYGVVLKWQNFRGRKETLELMSRFGYVEMFGLDYTIPYLNKAETLGLGVGASYGRSKETPVVNQNDKLVYYKDDKQYVMENFYAGINLIYRKRIYNSHTFSLSFRRDDFADTLLTINPSFSVNGESSLRYFSLSYQYKSDHRDYKHYPLNGHYFDVSLVKNGLGLVNGDGLDVFYVLTTFRKYLKFSRRIYYAAGLNSRFSNNSDQPYQMQQAIGYGRDIVRGYEYYVLNGRNFGIFKSNFKFALLPEREYDLPFIRSQKFGKLHYAFYLNAFLDLGFVDQANPQPSLNNELENSLLMGYGLGIDFVTYYDLVFRIEYSFNRMNEHGFFLHFTAPI